MYQLEERDREIQEAKSKAAKLPQIAARLYIAEQRTKQLEQLCRDMYKDMSAAAQPTAEPGYFAINTTIRDRMEQLGLLEEKK